MPNTPHRIAIVCVPYFRYSYHYELAVSTLISLLSHSTIHTLDLIAVVNSTESGDDHKKWILDTFNYVEINDENIVARAWNKGIKIGLSRGARYVLVINLDMSFHNRFIDNLVDFADNNPDALLWSGTPWSDQSTIMDAPLEGTTPKLTHYNCFLVDEKLFRTIGEFDEGFKPAYLEDVDMSYRIDIASQTRIGTNSARFYHINRGTILGYMLHNDEAYLANLKIQLDVIHERYKQKWGGLPGEESFTVPYNGKA